MPELKYFSYKFSSNYIIRVPLQLFLDFANNEMSYFNSENKYGI